MNFSWKTALILGLLLGSIVCLFPTLDMLINSKSEPTLWPQRQIVLGLDLQGGMHLELEVDTQKAVEGNVERIAQDIKQNSKCGRGSRGRDENLCSGSKRRERRKS